MSLSSGKVNLFSICFSRLIVIRLLFESGILFYVADEHLRCLPFFFLRNPLFPILRYCSRNLPSFPRLMNRTHPSISTEECLP